MEVRYGENRGGRYGLYRVGGVELLVVSNEGDVAMGNEGEFPFYVEPYVGPGEFPRAEALLRALSGFFLRQRAPFLFGH